MEVIDKNEVAGMDYGKTATKLLSQIIRGQRIRRKKQRFFLPSHFLTLCVSNNNNINNTSNLYGAY